MLFRIQIQVDFLNASNREDFESNDKLSKRGDFESNDKLSNCEDFEFNV